MNRENTHRPGIARRSARRGPGWPTAAAISTGVLAVLLVFSGCGDVFTRTPLREESCVRDRLTASAVAYDDAKSHFVQHYKARSDTSLRFSYMSSVDSSRLALSIRGCFDFDRSFVTEARSILRSNRLLRQLVRNNLRDSDPQQAIGIFGDQYRDIFKNDID